MKDWLSLAMRVRACACVCVRTRERVCACVCVCVRARAKDRERERERERELHDRYWLSCDFPGIGLGFVASLRRTLHLAWFLKPDLDVDC